MDVKTAIQNGGALRELLSEDSSRANELIEWGNNKCLTHPLHFISDMQFDGTLQKVRNYGLSKR